MGRPEMNLKDKLRKVLAVPDVVFDGEVTAVNEAEATCTVVLASGLEIPDVQLKALREATDAVLVLPSVGSTVQIIALGGPDYLVLNWEQIDKVVVTIGDSKLTMDADGFKLERSGESLTSILKDLITALTQATFTNGGGTTSFADNLTSFQQIAQRIPNLLT